MATIQPKPGAFPAPKATAATAFLDTCVGQAAARVRLRRALWGGATGLCAGVLPSLALVAGLRLSVFPDAFSVTEPYLLLPPLVGAAAWGVWAATRPVSREAVARRLDDALGLEDRFSSAVAFADNFRGDDALRRLQARDAETFARDLGRRPAELRTAVPLAPLPARAWAGLVGFALVAGLMIAPSLARRSSAAKPDTKTEQAQVKKEGERLLRLAQTLEARDRSRGNAAPHLSDARRVAAERLAKLGDDMKRGKLTRREAMIKAAKLTEEVKQTQRTLASERSDGAASQKSLMAAGRELQKAMQNAEKNGSQLSPNGLNNAPVPTPPTGANGKSPAAAQNGGKSLAQQKLNDAQKALAQNDAPALSQQLRKLADDMGQGEPKNAKEREKVARQVDALGDSLAKTRLSEASKSLKEAAQAAKNGDNKTAADKMHEAAAKVEQAEQRAGDAEAMQNAADALENKQDGDEQPQTATGEQQQAAEQAAQAGEGKSDAFGADGKIKPGGAGDSAGKDGKGQGGNGKGKGKSGQGQGKGNGIGTEAGTPGGHKSPTQAAGPYQDPRGAKAGLNKGKAGQKLVRNEKFTRLYAPDDQIPVTRVKGKRGDAGRESVSPFRGAPDKNAKPSSVPYYEVYGKYAPAAESAQRREDLPAPYKKQVKDYFDALRPDAGGGPGNPATPQRKP